MYRNAVPFLFVVLILIFGNIEVSAQQTYVLENAGLQFNAPTSWKGTIPDIPDIEKGSIHVMYVDKGAFTVTFFTGDNYQQTLLGLEDGLKSKLTDIQHTAITKEGHQAGLFTFTEEGTGIAFGKKMVWKIGVYKGGKRPLVMFLFGFSDAYEKHLSEYSQVATSIKKI